MDEIPLSATESPPISGVRTGQTVPTEIVDDLPDDLKHSGGLAQYPVTSVINKLMADSGVIKGDTSFLMLKSLVQNLERRAIQDHEEKRNTAEKLESAVKDNTALAVENAVLKKDVTQKESDRTYRAILVGVGGIGIGIAVPLMIQTANPGNVLATVVFLFLFIAGVSPERRKS